MPELTSRRRLDQPRGNSRFSFDIDPEAFGRFSENLARFLGTGKFLFWQTLFVILWIVLNVIGFVHHWDSYPFTFLNLAFSTQAAYAAPLILLAQNRQDDRDRFSLDEDRNRASQTKADTEFLARELAALRVAIGEIATRDYLRGEIDKLRGDLDRLSAGAAPEDPRQPVGKTGKSGKRADKPAADRVPAGKRKTTGASPAAPRATGTSPAEPDAPGAPADRDAASAAGAAAEPVAPSPGADHHAADR